MHNADVPSRQNTPANSDANSGIAKSAIKAGGNRESLKAGGTDT